MLYKKYTIEIICESIVIEKVSINSNNTYDNQIQLNLTPVEKTINVIKFLNKDGFVQDYEYYFETYEKAFSVLSTHYYNINNNHIVLTKKIVSVYNDLIPSVEVLRSMKMKKILKK